MVVPVNMALNTTTGVRRCVARLRDGCAFRRVAETVRKTSNPRNFSEILAGTIGNPQLKPDHPCPSRWVCRATPVIGPGDLASPIG
jgi:hypothetical protein